jgi:uncharacterized Fe-S radical SAM superfamily protein PflX
MGWRAMCTVAVVIAMNRRVCLPSHTHSFTVLRNGCDVLCSLATPVDLVKVQQQAVVGAHPLVRNGRTLAMLLHIHQQQGVAGINWVTGLVCYWVAGQT